MKEPTAISYQKGTITQKYAGANDAKSYINMTPLELEREMNRYAPSTSDDFVPLKKRKQKAKNSYLRFL